MAAKLQPGDRVMTIPSQSGWFNREVGTVRGYSEETGLIKVEYPNHLNKVRGDYMWFFQRRELRKLT